MAFSFGCVSVAEEREPSGFAAFTGHSRTARAVPLAIVFLRRCVGRVKAVRSTLSADC